MTGVAAVPEGTHNAPHPATTVVCAALWPMDAPVALMPLHTPQA